MFRKLNNNGHPVSPKDNRLVSEQEYFPKEACDVHIEYSKILPFPASTNYRPIRLSRNHSSSDRSRSGSKVPSDLPYLWATVWAHPQLGAKNRAGSGIHLAPTLATLLGSQDPLPLMSAHHRRHIIFPSLSASASAFGPPTYLITRCTDDIWAKIFSGSQSCYTWATHFRQFRLLDQ